MKNLTLEEKIIEIAKKAKTRVELVEKVNSIVEEAVSTDESLYSINRSLTGYGTWKCDMWCNEYHFGENIKKMIEKKFFITHDEEKEFSINDFKDMINDVFQEFAYENLE